MGMESWDGGRKVLDGFAVQGTGRIRGSEIWERGDVHCFLPVRRRPSNCPTQAKIGFEWATRLVLHFRQQEQTQNTVNTPTDTCQFVKSNQEGCKRRVATGQKYCWQHSHGCGARWRSLTRSQVIGFYVAVASLAATLWFGIGTVIPHTSSQAIQVHSSGNQSPNIVNNEGKVDIHNQQPDSQKHKSGKSATGTKQ